MKFKKRIAALSVAATPFLASAADYSTQITAAQTEGESNVGAATLAVIGIAIVGFGVTAIVSWMRR